MLSRSGLFGKRKQAEAPKDRNRVGPLDGVPIAWKDLIDLEGTVTTCASRTRDDEPAAEADAILAGHAVFPV